LVCWGSEEQEYGPIVGSIIFVGAGMGVSGIFVAFAGVLVGKVAGTVVVNGLHEHKEKIIAQMAAAFFIRYSRNKF